MAEVKIPALGESVTEAVVGTWLKKDGEAVRVDEAILELESDKANMDLAAEEAGVLRILVEEGATVAVGDVVATIEVGAVGAPEAAPSGDAPRTPEPKAETAPATVAEAPRSGPAARRIAEQAGVDLADAQATGPGGRVTKEDARRLADGTAGKADPTPPAPATPAAPAPAKPAAKKAVPPPVRVDLPGAGEAEERVPMSRIRKVIARRLVEAQQTAAILTTFNEVDLSAVLDLRKRYKEDFKKKHGVGLGFMSFFVKACCAAAREVPELNARIDGDDIVYRHHVNMGVAVGTEKGLVVPVVKGADQMSFAEIEAEIERLAGLAREEKLPLDALSGGTFTISNGGVYGSLLSTPILTPPQSGILGMHKIEKRAVVIDDQIVIRPMMYLALSYDHRIVDGKGAVTFLVRVKEALEEPARLALGV